MIPDVFEKAWQNIATKNTREGDRKNQVVTSVMAYFMSLRKKPVLDLAQRIAKLQKRVEQLAENVSLKFDDGKLVVKAAGSAESLLNEFRLGSDWFDPGPDIDNIIVAAIMTDPKRS